MAKAIFLSLSLIGLQTSTFASAQSGESPANPSVVTQL